MRRFFIEDITAGTVEAVLSGHELRHLTVLRLKEGDEVALFNGKGLELQARILAVTAGEARFSVISASESRGESPVEIVLIAGLSKARKPELIVQKATELGVNSIVFYNASRSVPEVQALQADKKLKRWRRVALEAAKQCRRSIVPAIAFVDGFSGALAAAAPAEVKLFFFEGGGRPAAEIFQEHKGSAPRRAAVLIGPEGGFTEEERAAALSEGFIEAGLGPRILRAETAAIVSVAIIQNLIGDM